jgi:hypothetical protein
MEGSPFPCHLISLRDVGDTYNIKAGKWEEAGALLPFVASGWPSFIISVYCIISIWNFTLTGRNTLH